MYGTIFNLNVKAGQKESLIREMKSNSDNPEGMVAWFLMSPDDSSKDLIGVAIFESKEHHIKNAESAEQNKAFEKMMEFLASEPTWTDGVFPIGEIA
ncbi:MAG: hypothetical protein CL773_05525 [Chloroflexi bacterium]|nr:hypothetical protein [Chloroflexota bacterium]MBL07290.1 hypothetical protein [Chloroflexota bacterium]|tara:strand:- start:4304 stop:4594 length:291 start_codon:yes stop_codon:yes gene_type:complete